jgi:streptogramin lyase
MGCLIAALAAAPAFGQQAPPAVPDGPMLPYTAVANPLPLPAGMTYGAVAGVAVNSKGHIFVFHRVAAPLVEFDEHGTFLRAFGEGTASRAHSVRIDAADNIWLVDSGDHIVTKLDPGGRVLMTLGTKGVAGSGDAAAAEGRFNIPSDVAIAPNGDIFISQGEGGGPDPRVIRFDASGKFVTTWSLAYAGGPRSNPHSIAVDRAGLVYVADRNVMRVRIFQPDGTPVRDLQLRNQACAIFIDPSQQIWIATGTDGQFMKIDADGKVLGYAGRRGTGLGELSEAHMLAVAPSGDVYVADTLGKKVERFVPAAR